MQTVNQVKSQVAQLESMRKLEFHSLMHETSLSEIPEQITASFALEFSEWLNKFARLQQCLPNWLRQLLLGETSAKSLPLPSRQTETCAPRVSQA